MTSAGFFFIAKNAVAALNFLLVVYSSLLIRKHDYMATRILSVALSLSVYILGFCWSSVAISVFTLLRDIYSDRAKSQKTWAVVGFCVLGTVATFAVNNFSGATLGDYIPAASMIFYTLCIFKAKSAAQMKAATAADTVLWILYDYKNFLIVNLILDFFLIFLPLWELYSNRILQRIRC